MTNHAKAPSAQPTLRQAASAASSVEPSPSVVRPAMPTGVVRLQAPSPRTPGTASSFAGLLVTGLALAALLILRAASPAPAVAAEGECPNEARRIEQSAAGRALPDCRAYEMVTPSEKDNNSPRAVTGSDFTVREEELMPYPGYLHPYMDGLRGARAAADGDGLAWLGALAPLPGSLVPGQSYLSTRGAAGWSSELAVPPLSTAANEEICAGEVGVVAWSQNLGRGVLSLFGGPGMGFANEPHGDCGHDEPQLAAGEGEAGFGRNLFVRDNAARSYRLVNATPAGAPRPTTEEDNDVYLSARFLAGSEDLSHVVFEEELPLTEDAPGWPSEWRGNDELYIWSEGGRPALRLLSVLPDGTLAGNPNAGNPNGTVAGKATLAGEAPVRPTLMNLLEDPNNVADFRHNVSADGSRIFFEAEGNLYVREDAYAEQSAAGECTEAEQQAEPGRACTLQLDTPGQGAAGPGGGGEWLAANAEGTKVFFADENKLTPSSTAEAGKPDLYEYDFEVKEGQRLKDLTVDSSEPADVLGLSGASEDGSYVYAVANGALTGSQVNSYGATAQAGKPNLYLLHAGKTTFIATLDSSADRCDWALKVDCFNEAFHEPTGSGSTARVAADGRFVAFNSTRSLTGYDNTEASTGRADYEIFLYEAEGENLACVSCRPDNASPTAGGATIRWPSQPSNAYYIRKFGRYPQRNVSNSGQVFFETFEPLVRQDTNGVMDVYEYEQGHDHLISSGVSETNSFFVDAAPSGGDVFFATMQPLLRSDTDSAFDYYDARVGGGFPEPVSPPPPCGDDEACRGAGGAAPVGGAPGSSSFSGRGNLRPHGSCRAFAHRARKLSHRAHRLQRNARRVAAHGHAGKTKAMSRKASRLAKRAHHLSRHAKRCRRAGRRADR